MYKFADKVMITPGNYGHVPYAKYVGRIGVVCGVDADDPQWHYVGFDGLFRFTPVPTHALQAFVGDYWYFAHLVGDKKPVMLFNTRLECLNAAKKLSLDKKNFPYLVVHAVETKESENLYEEYVVIGSVMFKAETLNA